MSTPRGMTEHEYVGKLFGFIPKDEKGANEEIQNLASNDESTYRDVEVEPVSRPDAWLVNL